MKRTPQILFALAVFLILSVYVFPIWKIDLRAPQYPEGIGLSISVNNITGQKPQDLQNINGLNHYIGMKEIVPESIPELVWMPWLFGGLFIFGLLTVFINKRGLYLAWTSSFVALGAVGLVDFYLWGYDYGHNLNPLAPIKVPGMTYQPPLIGSKQLLNMNALSVPDIAGILVFLSMGLALVGLFMLYKKKAPAKVGLLLIAGFFGFQACSSGPKQYDLGLDSCTNCSMSISQQSFVCQTQSEYSKAYFFDSIECLAAYAIKQEKEFNPEKSWVTHFGKGSEWVPLNSAFFVFNAEVKSPMGLSLVAFKDKKAFDDFYEIYGGNALSWGEVKDFVKTKWY